MKSVNKCENLKITEFDAEDVIATSGNPTSPTEPPLLTTKRDNVYRTFSDFKAPGNWF